MSSCLHSALLLALALTCGCSGSESRSEKGTDSSYSSDPSDSSTDATTERGVSAARKMPPPGHSGPVPTPAAQGVFRELSGQKFEHPATGEVWTIQGFAVIPNPVTGKGPVALLERDGEKLYLPVLTDADVEDLAHRIDPARPRPKGELSEEYRNALSRK